MLDLYTMTKSRPKHFQYILLFGMLLVGLYLTRVFLKDNFGSKLPIMSQLLSDTSEIISTPYISSKGTNLYLNGEQFQFTGINAYSIGGFDGNAGCGGQEKDLDAFFTQLRPNSVVRMWAFQGGITTNVKTKKTDWTGLDRVITAASRNGIKLLLVLSDQSGTCDDGHWKDIAWYSGGYTKPVNDLGNGLTPLSFLDYTKLIVDRYKDSPDIAMWELVNEPEAADCRNQKGSACYSKQICNEANATKVLRSFFDTVGGEVKKIDKNHLISSGVIGTGQCGASYENYKYIHQSPGIDVASYHDYGSDNVPMPGDKWNGLQKRLDQMKDIAKPIIVGEVGILAMNGSRDCMNLNTRRDKLKAKMDAQFKAGISGFMPWDLTGSVSKICNYDIGPNDPTLSLLYTYPVPMGTSSVTRPQPPFIVIPSSTPTITQPTRVPDKQAPTAPTNLSAITISSTEVALNWNASKDNVGVVRYDIFRNDKYLTSTTETNFKNVSLTPGDTYTYHVKGKDAAGNNSGSSNRITVTTPTK
jgi:mannan endo-1,4-beta-mannosidase